MNDQILSSGVVHEIPDDLRQSLLENSARGSWEDITPLARNEWICWVLNAKRSDTRARRVARVSADLNDGKRRPCCWPGCPHREKKG